MTVSETTVLEAVLRRDRLVVIAALVAVIVVAWIWIVLGAGTGMSAVAMTQMAGMPDMDMMMERAVWTPGYAGLIFAMWWVMMVAMMLPSAAPMLLSLRARQPHQKSAIVRTCRPGSSPPGTSRPGAASARSPPDCSGDWSSSACWAR